MKFLTACQRNLAIQFYVYMMQQTYGPAYLWPNPEFDEVVQIRSNRYLA